MERNRTSLARFTPAAIVFVLQHAVASFLRSGDAAAVQVTRGPYLQLVTPSSITIRWRTDEAAPSHVLIGDVPSALSSAAGSSEPTTEHEVTVTGLTPDRRYFYTIASDTEILLGAEAEQAFTTAPMPGTRKPTRLWVIGDSGTADEDAEAVRDAFASYSAGRPPDLWLMLGDNAYSEGSDDDYQQAVFGMFPDLLKNSVLWPSRGNHDESEEVYYGIFTLPAAGEAGGAPSGTEAYYSFDYGNLHVVCMDSEGSDRSADGEMATWLRNDLASHRGEWVIAYWHHPPYSKGSHDSDDEDNLRDMRENIVPILEAGRVDLVLAGHSHSYERSVLLRGHYGDSGTLTEAMRLDPRDGRESGAGAYRKSMTGHEGTVYAVVGCSGKTSGGSLDHPVMAVSLEELGSLVIDIEGARLDARFVDDSGVVRDEFTIVKTPKHSARPSLRDRGPRIMPSGPNPTAGGASMEYSLPAPGRARISIYAADGRRVARLRDAEHVPGTHAVTWAGRDEAGRRMPAGLYFAELLWEGERRTARLVKLD